MEHVSKTNKNVTSVEADPGDAIIWNGGIGIELLLIIQKAPDGLLFIVSVDGGLSLFNHSQTIPTKMLTQLNNEELTLLDYFATYLTANMIKLI